MVKWFLLICVSLGVSATALAKPLEPREVPTEIFLDRSGMPELVAQSMGTGLILGGLVTTNAFDDPVRQGSGFLLGPTLGASLPYLLNKNKPLHTSEALTYNFAQRFGLLNGFIVPFLWEEEDPSTFAGVMTVATLGSLGASIALYPKLELTPGQLSGLSTGLLVGGITGVLGLTGFSDDPTPTTGAATLLVTINAGALTAYLMRDYLDIDRSRVLMLDVGIGGGALLGAGLTWLLGGDDASEELYSLMILAGVYGGLFTSYKLTEGFDAYKKSATANPTSPKATLNSISPTLIPSVNPTTGRATLNPGLNLLNGTW